MIRLRCKETGKEIDLEIQEIEILSICENGFVLPIGGGKYELDIHFDSPDEWMITRSELHSTFGPLPKMKLRLTRIRDY